MNWFWVGNVHRRVIEPQVKLHERQEFITLRYTVSFVWIWSWNAWRSVVRKNSLLKTAFHRTRARKLLSRFPASAVDFILFTDENNFTVASPVNLQNDRCVYVCIRSLFRTLMIWSDDLWRHGLAFTSRLSTRQLNSGARLRASLVWKLVDDILNTWSDHLCCALRSFRIEWLTLASDFAALCFMSAEAALDVFSAWVTIKYNASI